MKRVVHLLFNCNLSLSSPRLFKVKMLFYSLIDALFRASYLPFESYQSFFARLKGNGGILIRRKVYKKFFLSFGEGVSISTHTYFYHPEKISLGNNVYVNSFCYINGVGGVSIGDNTLIGTFCMIHSADHKTRLKDGRLNASTGHVYLKTVISDNCWIAAHCCILAGSRIGGSSVIAAGSVVKNEIPEKVLSAGVPAKVVKKLEDDEK